MGGASGSKIKDDSGKEYIDITSGWNVANLGWNDPVVAEAIAKQAAKNVYAPMWTADPIQEEFAELLTGVLGNGFDACCRATGGTEAVEMSLKIARAATGRKKIVGFSDSYHGQLFASLAIGYRPNSGAAIRPFVPEFVQLDYRRTNDDGSTWLTDAKTLQADLEQALQNRDVAALIIESGIVTGWGSAYVMPEGFVKTARELTKKYGTLLIIDEVGTGFGRIGALFGHQYAGVVPDILTFAKALTNGGAAMGAVVTRSEIVEPTIPYTNLTSTFGWTPVACAAAIASLKRHQELGTWKLATDNGAYLMNMLRQGLKNSSSVVDIRGLGLEMGIQLRDPEGGNDTDFLNKTLRRVFADGVHATSDGENVILVMPPLTTSRQELDQVAQVLEKALGA